MTELPLKKEEPIEDLIQKSVDYLNSELAMASIESDPYWPKWDSPWWHMSLLFEMGLSSLIPDLIVEKMIDKMNTQYLRFFPLDESELPHHINPYTQIACHCQLGNMYQILRSKRKDIDQRMPWVRPWFLKYQLPDGGLNCDERAYTNSHKSSIESSLPVFEALMVCAEQDVLSQEEIAFLQKAAGYLISHRLVHKTSGQLMDENFLKLQFPRFYSYDILRGLSLLVRWHAYGPKGSISDGLEEVITYGLEQVSNKLVNGMLYTERTELVDATTWNPNDEGQWDKVEPVSIFPLLKQVTGVGQPSKYLSFEFEALKKQFIINQPFKD